MDKETDRTIEALTKTLAYTPDQQRFDDFVEWALQNPRGTYADYLKWRREKEEGNG